MSLSAQTLGDPLALFRGDGVSAVSQTPASVLGRVDLRGIFRRLLPLWPFCDSDLMLGSCGHSVGLAQTPLCPASAPLRLLHLPPRMSVPLSSCQGPTSPARLPPPGGPLGLPPSPGMHPSFPHSDHYPPCIRPSCESSLSLCGLCSGRRTGALSALTS